MFCTSSKMAKKMPHPYIFFLLLELNIRARPRFFDPVEHETMYASKGFVFYGVTFDLCRFFTFVNSAQLAGWAKFKNVQNLHKSNVMPYTGYLIAKGKK